MKNEINLTYYLCHFLIIFSGLIRAQMGSFLLLAPFPPVKISKGREAGWAIRHIHHVLSLKGGSLISIYSISTFIDCLLGIRHYKSNGEQKRPHEAY